MGERGSGEEAGREFWDLYQDLTRASIPSCRPSAAALFWRRDRARARMLAILQPILDERCAYPDDYDDFLQDFVNSRYTDTQESIEDKCCCST